MIDLKNIFSKKQKNLLMIITFLLAVMGFWQWRDTFFQTYYPDDTSIKGQLFPNITHTKIETEDNLIPFTGVRYNKVVIKIGSLSSEYDDSNHASKGNNIINRKTLDKNFKKWLIEAFDEEEAKKISDHIEVYYRGERINEIGY